MYKMQFHYQGEFLSMNGPPQFYVLTSFLSSVYLLLPVILLGESLSETSKGEQSDQKNKLFTLEVLPKLSGPNSK